MEKEILAVSENFAFATGEGSFATFASLGCQKKKTRPSPGWV
jgi:hypothetical protein